MEEKWYFFAFGVILSAALFSFLNMSLPGSVFEPVSETGLIVKEALREDFDVSHSQGVNLIGYSAPFDGSENVPESVVYNSKSYYPKVVSYSELKEYAGMLKIKYLISIGESNEGKFPIYLVQVGNGEFVEGVILLDEAFPREGAPFT
ncbi:hypothetical protein K8R43_06480 [archaeon]|nr:hypothetical protein [archaeon]